MKSQTSFTSSLSLQKKIHNNLLEEIASILLEDEEIIISYFHESNSQEFIKIAQELFANSISKLQNIFHPLFNRECRIINTELQVASLDYIIKPIKFDYIIKANNNINGYLILEYLMYSDFLKEDRRLHTRIANEFALIRAIG